MLLEFYGGNGLLVCGYYWVIMHMPKTACCRENGAVITTIFQHSKRLFIDLTIGRGFHFYYFL